MRNGGIVPRFGTYTVGELGPECFIPLRRKVRWYELTPWQWIKRLVLEWRRK